jgi:hypothetical protein
VKVNTTETWLSLLEAQIEKKAKKDLEKKKEDTMDFLQLTSQVEKLEVENNLLHERIRNFQKIEDALANVQDIAAAFNHSLTTIIESHEKEESMESRLERVEEELVEHSRTTNEFIQREKEYVTKAILLEKLEHIENKLVEKIRELENRITIHEGKIIAEKDSIERKGVRRRIKPDNKSGE